MSSITAAAACAAFLMGTPVATPDIYHEAKPSPERCRAAGDADGDCRGLFGVTVSGKTTHITAINDFGVLVHESCHLIQHTQGWPRVEDQCYAVQARAGECFEGLGHTGEAAE